MKVWKEIRKGNWKKREFWKRLWWSFQWWMWTSAPVYVNTLDFRRLYSDWKPWKKYFRRPHITYKTHWYGTWTRMFRLEIKELQWKSKWRVSVHENDPSIHLTIFGHNWLWEVSPLRDEGNFVSSVAFYETLLWLRDNRHKYTEPAQLIYNAISNNLWGSAEDWTKNVGCHNMLTRYGRLLYDIGENSAKIDKENSTKEPEQKDRQCLLL